MAGGIGSIISGISMSQALGLMGGSPVIKSSNVIINNLKAAKVLESGGVPPQVMQALSGGGLMGMLKNPMSQKGGGAKGASSQAVAALQERAKGSDLHGALQGLDQVIDEVMEASANIVGLSADANALIAMIGYTGTANALGEDSPFSSRVILKPALSDAEMETAQKVAEDVPYAFFAGAISEAVAVQRINEQTAILREIVQASTIAIAYAQQMAILIASASAATSLLVGGTPDWAAIMNKAIFEDLRLSIDALNDEFLAEKREVEARDPASS